MADNVVTQHVIRGRGTKGAGNPLQWHCKTAVTGGWDTRPSCVAVASAAHVPGMCQGTRVHRLQAASDTFVRRAGKDIQ